MPCIELKDGTLINVRDGATQNKSFAAALKSGAIERQIRSMLRDSDLLKKKKRSVKLPKR